MGTRADFYQGGTDPAEMIWLGSIAWDGYPSGIDGPGILDATTEQDYVEALLPWLQRRDDYTHPERGWPWPWDDSNTTDYAYTFDAAQGRVLANGFGHGWFVAAEDEPDSDDEDYVDAKPTPYPDMSDRKNVRWDKGSGVIVIQ